VFGGAVVVVTTVNGSEPGANVMCFATLSLPALSNFTMSAACDNTCRLSALYVVQIPS
jgi:hypothetical protein